MNKRNYLKTLGILLALFYLMLYGCFVIGAAEFNIFNFGDAARGFFAIAIFFGTVIILFAAGAAYSMDKEKNEN